MGFMFGITGSVIGFSPLDVAGLQVWLKGEDLIGSDGASISSWVDASGNGNDATQPIGLNQPIKKISIVNGRDVVRFDGLLSELDTLFNRTSLTSLFIVTQCSDPTSDGGGGRIFGYGGNDSMGPFGTGTSWGYYQEGGGGVETLGGIPISWTIISLTENGATNSAYLNGVLAASFSSINIQTAPLSFGMTLGGGHYSGDIAEVIVYDSVLSTLDRVRVESYLMDKYAL